MVPRFRGLRDVPNGGVCPNTPLPRKVLAEIVMAMPLHSRDLARIPKSREEADDEFRERREQPLSATSGSSPVPTGRGAQRAICSPSEGRAPYSVTFPIGNPALRLARPVSSLILTAVCLSKYLRVVRPGIP